MYAKRPRSTRTNQRETQQRAYFDFYLWPAELGVFFTFLAAGRFRTLSLQITFCLGYLSGKKL